MLQLSESTMGFDPSKYWTPTMAPQEVVMACLPFVLKLAKRYSRMFDMSFEDARQSGFLGVYEALKRYRPSMEMPFCDYVGPFIVGSIREDGYRTRRGPSTSRRYANMESSARFHSLKSILFDAYVDPEDDTGQREDKFDATEIDTRLSTLRERDRQIARLFLGLDGESPMNFSEIGKRIGVTRQAVQLRFPIIIAQLSGNAA